MRLIQAEDARTTQRFHQAASALSLAADSESARLEAEALQQRLFVDTQAMARTRLRIEHPGAEPLSVIMVRPYLVIGSDPSCDLTLNHEEVAPRHAFLQWVDGQIYCCDISPRPDNIPSKRQPPNGQWLKDEPFPIGPFQLQLDGEDTSPEPDYSPLDRSSRLLEEIPQFALQFKGVEQSDNQWPVNRVLTMIGRGIQCKLRLNHPSMPNVQACLLRTKKGLWLIDVAGEGTTGVNGRTVGIAAIDIGDTLQLGPFQVEVVTTVFEPIDLTAPPRKKKPAPPAAPAPVESRTSALPKPPAQKAPASAKPRTVPAKKNEESKTDSSLNSMTPTSSSLEAMDSLVRSASPTPVDLDRLALDPQAPAAVTGASTSPISVRPELIAEFVQSQQSQLALLKSGLDQLKADCDEVSGRTSSKGMKNLLIKSVTETLQTQVAMSQSLVKLIESIEVDR